MYLLGFRETQIWGIAMKTTATYYLSGVLSLWLVAFGAVAISRGPGGENIGLGYIIRGSIFILLGLLLVTASVVSVIRLQRAAGEKPGFHYLTIFAPIAVVVQAANSIADIITRPELCTVCLVIQGVNITVAVLIGSLSTVSLKNYKKLGSS
jgi:hypothetical protein